MSVYVAYRQLGPSDSVGLDRATERVKRWYELAKNIDVDRSGDASGGLVRWSTPSATTWWEWTRDSSGATALPFPPILPGKSGTRHEIKSQALQSTNECVPPFAVLHHDCQSGRVTATTDILGLGKIYWLHTSRGIYLSNQPVALLLFSGTEPELDETGWMHKASIGWFMENTTAYRGVQVMPPAVSWIVNDDGAIKKRALPRLLSSGPPKSEVGPTQFALQQTMASTSSILSNPALSLSGGRDSRLVVASYLSTGLDFSCSTNDSVPGEVDVAQRLIDLLPVPIRHQVRSLEHYTADPREIPLLQRALNWHNWSEGARSEGYLWSRAPSPRLVSGVPQGLGGAGGDVAHGYYYGSGIQSTILSGTSELPNQNLRKQLMRRLFRSRAEVSNEVKAGSRAVVRKTLLEADAEGLSGFSLWDYFYLYERVRRWSGAAEPLAISPLHTPAFMRHALRIEPYERVNNVLHRELIHRMVPVWSEVPFFHQMERIPKPVLRAAQAGDADEIAGIIDQDPTWRQFYDENQIQNSWELSQMGSSSGRDERYLRQVIWLAGFQMHLEEVRRALRV